MRAAFFAGMFRNKRSLTPRGESGCATHKIRCASEAARVALSCIRSVKFVQYFFSFLLGFFRPIAEHRSFASMRYYPPLMIGHPRMICRPAAMPVNVAYGRSRAQTSSDFLRFYSHVWRDYPLPFGRTPLALPVPVTPPR